jgi:predicted dehydrogenase
MTRWGIIGPGKIAHQFAHDLGLLEETHEISAVLGHSATTTEDFARQFRVSRVFFDLASFVKNAGADIVYIATPNTLHLEQALACLHHKVPVLCEKPMTINLVQCNELIRSSRLNKTFLMEGLWIRFLPTIQQLLHFIERGDIGRVVSIKASMGFKARPERDHRLFKPHLGGGSLLDLGIYPIFLALLLLGLPDTIKAIGTLSDEGVDENCSILFHYRNKQHAILESTLLSSNEIPAEITGEKGIIRILNPWFEKSAGLEVDSEHRGKVALFYE